MWKTIIYVAIGSIIGGVGRFLLQQYMQRRVSSTFPYGTFTVNIVGCFIIGIVFGLASRGNVLSVQMRIFLATGVCGGFTTFSSFINENYSMLQDGELLHTFIYISISIA